VQFNTLAALFHSRGYNVLIPRLPRHGYRDRLSRDQGQLTRTDYVACANQAVDLGRGLGQSLAIVGLSVSGVLAAWCAQHRSDVDLAVPIAPAFGPFGVPLGLIPVLSRLAVKAPNLFIWWDPRRRARLGPECNYPRFSTHAMAEAFLLGAEIYAAAAEKPAASRSILTVTNRRDPAVNNALTRALVQRWRRYGAADAREYEFGREVGPLHDIIGPYQPNARVEYIYPIVFEQIDRALAGAR
jgi:alpha-beta hydrolase superfamily lysophospholipase